MTDDHRCPNKNHCVGLYDRKTNNSVGKAVALRIIYMSIHTGTQGLLVYPSIDTSYVHINEMVMVLFFGSECAKPITDSLIID